MNAAGLSRWARSRPVRACGLVAGAVALVMTLAAAAAPAPGHAVGSFRGDLHGISVVSPADAWAVGVTDNAKPGLVLHWNGTSWTKAAVPVTGKGFQTEFDGVSADSATDAWAVGMNDFSSPKYGGCDNTVVVHWNGTEWTQAATPDPGQAPAFDDLLGVSALSRSDAWAVGYYGSCKNTLHSAALILHWNGTAWTKVPAPVLKAQSSDLAAVTALSPGDVWAVGSVVAQPLVLHWNGTSWTRVARSARNGAELDAVTALSPGNVWAVGDQTRTAGATDSLVLHWNGSHWTQVASPSPGGSSPSDFTYLQGVSADSASDAWAVGYYGHTTATNTFEKTLALHWNGSSWTRVASPHPGRASGLRAVTALSAGNAWAVGTGQGFNTTLVLHWNGTAWTQS